MEAGKPDLRFFVEATAENRTRGDESVTTTVVPARESVFVGPTSLLVYKAIALEGGMLFPLYLRVPTAPSRAHSVSPSTLRISSG